MDIPNKNYIQKKNNKRLPFTGLLCVMLLFIPNILAEAGEKTYSETAWDGTKNAAAYANKTASEIHQSVRESLEKSPEGRKFLDYVERGHEGATDDWMGTLTENIFNAIGEKEALRYTKYLTNKGITPGPDANSVLGKGAGLLNDSLDGYNIIMNVKNEQYGKAVIGTCKVLITKIGPLATAAEAGIVASCAVTVGVGGVVLALNTAIDEYQKVCQLIRETDVARLSRAIIKDKRFERQMKGTEEEQKMLGISDDKIGKLVTAGEVNPIIINSKNRNLLMKNYMAPVDNKSIKKNLFSAVLDNKESWTKALKDSLIFRCSFPQNLPYSQQIKSFSEYLKMGVHQPNISTLSFTANTLEKKIKNIEGILNRGGTAQVGRNQWVRILIPESNKEARQKYGASIAFGEKEKLKDCGVPEEYLRYPKIEVDLKKFKEEFSYLALIEMAYSKFTLDLKQGHPDYYTRILGKAGSLCVDQWQVKLYNWQTDLAKKILKEVNKEVNSRLAYWLFRKQILNQIKNGHLTEESKKKAQYTIEFFEWLSKNAERFYDQNMALCQKYVSLRKVVRSKDPMKTYKKLLTKLTDEGTIKREKRIDSNINNIVQAYKDHDVESIIRKVSMSYPDRGGLATKIKEGIAQLKDFQQVNVAARIEEIKSSHNRYWRDRINLDVSRAIEDMERNGKGWIFRIGFIKGDLVAKFMDDFGHYMATGPDDPGIQTHDARVSWMKTVSTLTNKFNVSGEANLIFIHEKNPFAAPDDPKWEYLLSDITGEMFWEPLELEGSLTVKVRDVQGALVKGAYVTVTKGGKQVGAKSGSSSTFSGLKKGTYHISAVAQGYQSSPGKTAIFDPLKTPQKTEIILKKEPAPEGEKKQLVIDLPYCKYWIIHKNHKPYMTGYYYTSSGQKINYTSLPIANYDKSFPAAGMVVTKGETGYHVYCTAKHNTEGYDFEWDQTVNGNYIARPKGFGKNPAQYMGSSNPVQWYIIVNRMKEADSKIIHRIKSCGYLGVYPSTDFSSYTVKYQDSLNGPVKTLVLD